MLFVRSVIARVFNVIAAIYFQVAYQHGGSVCLCMYINSCVSGLLFHFGT